MNAMSNHRDARSVLEEIATKDLRRCNAGYLAEIAVGYLTSKPRRDGAERISAERMRQVVEKRWTVEHDAAEHADGSLADAASALLLEYDGASEAEVESVIDRAPLWVGDLVRHASEKYVGQNRYRLLEIAGALIAAELDRLGGAA
jgi:hypothetical protein